jgi:hypothetical protein
VTQKEANAMMARWAIDMIEAGAGPTDQLVNEDNGAPRSPGDETRCRKALEQIMRPLFKMAGTQEDVSR